MKIYYVWITALTDSYQDGIIAGLVKKGYMVGPASKEGRIIAPGESASAVITLSIYSEKEFDAGKLHADTAVVLSDMKAYCYSIIASGAADCAWTGSNFNIQTALEAVQPPKKAMN
jgi:hypothetical protein